MAGVSYRFALDDLVVLSALDRTAAEEDLFPLMDAIGRVLVNGAVERITVTNVDPDGVPWPQSFRAEVFGGPTLHASGRLARSITSAPESREVTVGSNLVYAAVHQEGAIIRAKTAKGLFFMLADGEEVVVGEVTVPRRPYLGISIAEREDIGDLTVSHFTGLLDGGLH
ncbi:phage virion morphogenesis protein [Paracoccus denitrificans]|uniref:phage virion morphogenesis protein n=1 Tax=Paracoccus denitrificans TaxID=266 RepID=UPI001E48151F|nr:phage virion morphogenesis protein [Paracoccus denitrificans]UFS63840.1 phage virion morphogenesis protein [Paracoccus denitrificans]